MSFKNPLEGFNQDARIQDPRALWHVLNVATAPLGALTLLSRVGSDFFEFSSNKSKRWNWHYFWGKFESPKETTTHLPVKTRGLTPISIRLSLTQRYVNSFYLFIHFSVGFLSTAVRPHPFLFLFWNPPLGGSSTVKSINHSRRPQDDGADTRPSQTDAAAP